MISDELLVKVRRILANHEDIYELNENLKQKTGLLEFFTSSHDIEEFKEFITNLKPWSEKTKDLGDFQTPNHLTNKSPVIHH